ncbi:hypothetical protein BaRGS_00018921, partial [Batillaria attramentaria]
ATERLRWKEQRKGCRCGVFGIFDSASERSVLPWYFLTLFMRDCLSAFFSFADVQEERASLTAQFDTICVLSIYRY